MPRHRPSRELWRGIRRIILERDGWRCTRCGCALTVATAHIDHIQSGKLGTNKLRNLRALCRRDHVLRSDPRHRGMIAAALRDGIIGPDWREHVWDG